MLRSLWSALRRKDDLSEELKSHLQMAIADRIARGESPAEARWAATREFGNVPLIADVTRERWGWLQLEHLLQDLRSALRHMRRSPGFSITAVLTLALGIGALTTVATWSNAVLYNPWPHVESPRDLRFVDATVLGNNGYSVHYDNYRFVRESGHSWKDAVAFAQTQVNLTQPGAQPAAFTAGLVSSNYFQFLGVRPQSGRFFIRMEMTWLTARTTRSFFLMPYGAIAAAFLLITVFLSGVSPARRAASVQPMQALREE